MKNVSDNFKHGLEKVKNDTKDGLNNLEQDFNGIKKDFNIANQYLNELRAGSCASFFGSISVLET